MFKGTIRELEPKDAEAVEKIYDLYWTGDFRKNLSNRLHQYITQAPEAISQAFKYFVAEENGEVVGVAALRSAPDFIKQYTTTERPVEFYIAAAKRKREGIGSTLRLRLLEETAGRGCTEVILYSGATHKDSWGFHDQLGFERVGPTIAPNGEAGIVWRKVLK